MMMGSLTETKEEMKAMVRKVNGYEAESSGKLKKVGRQVGH